jgi:DNA-binding transcriptional LysR family regulator
LSQPALSVSLRRLEESVQAKLVKRTPKGVELTPIGAALLTHVSRLRLAKDDLAREVADLAGGRSGRLRVGTGPGTSEDFLPEACSLLIKEAPKAYVEVVIVGTTDALLPTLASGDLDLVVSHVADTPRQEFDLDRLRKDEFVVYASASHRLARRRSVALADLVHERWASTAGSAFQPWQSLQRTFEERGLPQPLISLVSDSIMLRFRTVASTDLLGIASRRIVEANAAALRLKIVPVRDEKWMRSVAIVRRRGGYLSPAARRFIEILKATAKTPL